MPLTGTYEPSTMEWAREQAEKFEAANPRLRERCASGTP